MEGIMSFATTCVTNRSDQATASRSQAGFAAAQTPGMQLYAKAVNGFQKEALVKRQFEQSSPDEQTELADDFVSAAGEDDYRDTHRYTGNCNGLGSNGLAVILMG
jgi:hypothetical protein